MDTSAFDRAAGPIRASLRWALFVLALGWSSMAVAFDGKDVSTQKIGGLLGLTDHLGQRRNLTDFRGKAVLIFFGYTHCPDVCPTTLARLAQTMKLLGTDSDHVTVLWVTVDPERDTQDLLAHYVPAFNVSFIGLRGSARETAAVADAFKVRYQVMRYNNEVLVDHSSFGYLIDPRGRTRVKIPYDMTPTQIAHDVRAVLAGV